MSPAERRRRLADAAEALAADRPGDPYAELQAQNQELVRTLATLRERELDQDRLNLELSETNRGVLALYAELDDRAAELARASQLKSAFLSGISHELRTPLNSILNMTRILLERMDGELAPEQDRQVSMIRRAAASPHRAGQRSARPGPDRGREDRSPGHPRSPWAICSAPCAACSGRWSLRTR